MKPIANFVLIERIKIYIEFLIKILIFFDLTRIRNCWLCFKRIQLSCCFQEKIYVDSEIEKKIISLDLLDAYSLKLTNLKV